MLNEVLALEQGLAEHGFESVPRHPDLSQLLRGDVLRVRLAATGAVDDLERLDGKMRPDIWTLRDGNHNGFPGLKTARGLLQLDAKARTNHDELWKKARTFVAKRTEIERLAATFALDPAADDWPKPGHRKRIRERLDVLRALEAEPDACAVPAVFERFLRTIKIEPPFLHRLHAALLDRVRSGDDTWPDLARAALVDAVPIAFDVTGDFPRDAGDARQVAAVSRALSGIGNGGNDGPRGICAMTGCETRLLEGPFPQPTLPSLGQSYLFSRNTDIRALARYGRNGPSSMPVDADLAGRFFGALADVTRVERRNRMWRLLPANAGDGQDLFISFIASAPDKEVARSLMEADEDDEEKRRPGPAQVEAAAEPLVKFWHGIAGQAKPGEHARILILRTVDPGNRQVAYDKSPLVAELHGAAREWATAMRNAPRWITWPVFNRTTRKSRPGHPRVEPPLSLVPLSRKLYVRGGREAVSVPGISGAEALALFLNEGDQPRRARRMLRLMLDRHTGLLVGINNAKLRGQLKDFDPKMTSREDALRSAAWIGALIALIDPTKESYMEDTGFKLGQLLSAADAVHAGYCAAVRGGDMPPTLIGNSVFAAAGRNPDRALDVLQTRWKPYHAWVDRARRTPRKKPENNEAEAAAPDSTAERKMQSTKSEKDVHSWTIYNATMQAQHAVQLCKELHPALARMRSEGRAPDEAFRAELLLGYVAGVQAEKKDKAEAETKGAKE